MASGARFTDGMVVSQSKVDNGEMSMLMRFIRGILPVVAVVALAVVGVSAGSAHGLAPRTVRAQARRARVARPRVARHGVLRAPKSALLHLRRGKPLRAGANSSAPTPITSCGVVLTEPGTYALAHNVDGSGDQYCIWIAANRVKLNLNGHKVTDHARNAEYGVVVQASGSTISLRNDQVYGGSIKDYKYGVDLEATIRASVSDLRILMGSVGAFGVYADYAAHSLSKGLHIFVDSSTETGWYAQDGSGNTVTGSFISHRSGSPALLETEYEYQDTFSNDTAACRLPNGRPTYDCGGTGFLDQYSTGNTFSGDKSYGNDIGFELAEDNEGTVTATDNTATDYNLGNRVRVLWDRQPLQLRQSRPVQALDLQRQHG